jgi:nucleotide-binding universal stress UspA family protein
MRRIVAALGDDAAAPGVVAAAAAVGRLFAAEVELVNVREDGPAAAAEAAAAAAGLTLATLPGDPYGALSAAAEREDVVALVLAACGAPDAGHRLSHTTRQLITSVSKPIVVVPVGYAPSGRIARVLVPLDGTPASAVALRGTVEMAAEAEVEVVLVHVLDVANLPAFGDQVAHEVRTWSDAFIARNAPTAVGARLELRPKEERRGVSPTRSQRPARLGAVARNDDLRRTRQVRAGRRHRREDRGGANSTWCSTPAST